METALPEPGRKKLSTTAIVVLVILGVQLGPMLVIAPAMLVVFLVSGSLGEDGPDAIGVQLAVLAVVGMVLAGVMFALRNTAPVRGGLPAGPRRLPYDLRGPGALGDRLRRLADPLQAVHHGVLWGLVAVVGLCAVGILAAVVAGPNGSKAAVWALLLFGGWLLTLLAYVACGYRFLLPAGGALLAYGLLLHVDAVGRSWGTHLPGSIHAVALLATLWVCLAPAIEARARVGGPGWAAAGWAASLLMAAFPLLHLVGSPSEDASRLAAGISSAGVLLGLSGALVFVRVGTPWRFAAFIVTAFWGAATLVAAAAPDDLRQRIMAAIVLVVLVMAIAMLTAFFVQRPKAIAA